MAETFPMAWGQKVDTEFRAKVISICKDFGWRHDHASWLMACMAFESAETFRPDVRNAAGSGATGLIQFMPATAKGLGTSTSALAAMKPVMQLDYVKKYFAPYARKIKSLPDMYMAILLPKYVGSPSSAVLFSGGVAYRQNSGLDLNKDGKITKQEASFLVSKKLEKGMKYSTREPVF